MMSPELQSEADTCLDSAEESCGEESSDCPVDFGFLFGSAGFLFGSGTCDGDLNESMNSRVSIPGKRLNAMPWHLEDVNNSTLLAEAPSTPRSSEYDRCNDLGYSHNFGKFATSALKHRRLSMKKRTSSSWCRDLSPQKVVKRSHKVRHRDRHCSSRLEASMKTS